MKRGNVRDGGQEAEGGLAVDFAVERDSTGHVRDGTGYGALSVRGWKRELGERRRGEREGNSTGGGNASEQEEYGTRRGRAVILEGPSTGVGEVRTVRGADEEVRDGTAMTARDRLAMRRGDIRGGGQEVGGGSEMGTAAARDSTGQVRDGTGEATGREISPLRIGVRTG